MPRPGAPARNSPISLAVAAPLTIGLVALTLALRLAAGGGPPAPAHLQVFVVPVALAALLGRPYGLGALALSALAGKVFLMRPLGSLTFDTGADVVRHLTLAVVGIGIVELVVRLRASRGLAATAESEAQASAARLALLIEHTPAAVAMLDRDLRYLAVSRRYLEAYRIEGRPVIGRSHYEVFPEIPERWREIHRRCLAGAVEHCDEEPFPRSDGRTDWVRWTVHPWRDERGEIGGIALFSEVVTEQRLARQAEDAARGQLEAAFQALQDGVAIFDSAGTIVRLNEASARISGFPSVAAMRQDLPFFHERYELRDLEGRLVPPADWPINGVLRGESVDRTLQVHRLDTGLRFVMRQTGAPVFDASGAVKLAVVVTRDITDAWRAEARLAAESERLAATLRSVGEGVVATDDADRITLLNPIAETLTGWTASEAVGRRLDEVFVLRVDAPEAAGDSMLLARDGTTRPVGTTEAAILNPDGQHAGRVIAFWDRTRERAAARALAESEAHYRALFEQAAVGVLVTAVDTDRVLDVNERLCALLGYDRAALLGRHVSDLSHPEDPPLALGHLGPTPGRGRPVDVPQYERPLRRRDGAPIWVAVTSALLPGDDRETPGAVVHVVEDVTEARRLREELLQSQKLESLGRLAGGIAHDFNNLLTVIINCADALRDALAEGRRPDAEDVGQIRQSGDRAAALTRQLLAFARKQVVAPRVADLNDLVRASEKMLVRLIGEDVRVETALDPGLWPVRVDPVQVEQILLNLAVNARDAMPGGGCLRIETGNLTEPSDGCPVEWVRMVVADDGEGMSAEVRARVFDPFFTTKPTGKGTGLGLSTVHGIVRQAGGRISVQSAPGQGARFVIDLPRAGGSATDVVRASAGPSGAGELILVVEDEPAVRGVLVRTLTRAGYRVVAAGSAREALALFDAAEAGPAPVGMVLTDVIMPEMDGFHLVVHLRERRPSLPALFISGHPDDALAGRDTLTPPAEVLGKPFSLPDLHARIRKALDGG
jgi:PAS domain S-box-containing protein